jgi:hypothetical protein
VDELEGKPQVDGSELMVFAVPMAEQQKGEEEDDMEVLAHTSCSPLYLAAGRGRRSWRGSSGRSA